ncbi:unnamed protein product, partial [Musa acuminata subsp. burmannicoides]
MSYVINECVRLQFPSFNLKFGDRLANENIFSIVSTGPNSIWDFLRSDLETSKHKMRFEKLPAVVFPLRAATSLRNRPRPCVPTRVLQVGRTGIVSPLGTYSIMDLEVPHAPPPTCEPLSRTTAPP